MRNIILGIIAGLVLGGVLTWAYLKRPAGHEPEKKEEPKEAKRVQRGTNGEVLLKLDKEAQNHAGLKAAALEGLEIYPEIKGFGRVLDPSALATQLVEIGAAKATLEASRKEYERLKTLHSQNQNVAARALEAAEAAAKRDEILFQAAQARLMVGWGKSVTERKELPGLVDSLISVKSAIVRIDLAVGQALRGVPTAIRIKPLVSEETFFDAEFLGLAPKADPQIQGQGFLFLVQTNGLAPGTAVTGYLKIPGPAKKGVSVPNTALVRFESEVFVYLQISEDTFRREEAKLDTPTAKGWLVTEGLKPGEKVVVAGAQQLLSEELKSRSADE